MNEFTCLHCGKKINHGIGMVVNTEKMFDTYHIHCWNDLNGAKCNVNEKLPSADTIVLANRLSDIDHTMKKIADAINGIVGSNAIIAICALILFASRGCGK